MISFDFFTDEINKNYVDRTVLVGVHCIWLVLCQRMASGISHNAYNVISKYVQRHVRAVHEGVIVYE